MCCAACSSQPRYGGDYTRRCPHPEKITEFLQQNLDFGSILTPAIKICTSCYLFHRRILQQLESVSSTTHHALDSIVSDLQTKLKQFDIEGRISVTDTSFLSWNVCKVCFSLVPRLSFSLWEGRGKREPGIHCLRMLENYCLFSV